MTLWIDAELNAPIQVLEADFDTLYEFVAVQIGEQDPALFALPEDFERVSPPL